jgi:hypothetical protein
MTNNPTSILDAAARFRREMGDNLHDKLPKRFTLTPDKSPPAPSRPANRRTGKFRTIFRPPRHEPLVRFSADDSAFDGGFWLTIAGANIPSAMLGELLQGTVYNLLHGFANS